LGEAHGIVSCGFFSRQETRGYFIQVRGDRAAGLMAHKAPLERAVYELWYAFWKLEAGSQKKGASSFEKTPHFHTNICSAKFSRICSL